MTNTRIAAVGYVVLALAAGLWLEHVLLAVFGNFGPPSRSPAPWQATGPGARFIGLGLTGATALYLWTHPRTHQVSMEIVAELRKVSWPSFAETRAATVAVVVFSLIAAIVLGFFDAAWQYFTDKIQNPSL